MAPLLLKVEKLEIAYGDVAAVRDVSFEVAEGEIVTLIGANGAGKSTTMRGVAGSMLSRKGKILFDGIDVTRLPAHARAAAGIALVPEGRRVFPALTVQETTMIPPPSYGPYAGHAVVKLSKKQATDLLNAVIVGYHVPPYGVRFVSPSSLHV